MPEHRFETVANCVERLGPPPAEIARAWLDDARLLRSGFVAEEFDPAAAIWRSMQVDESGHLVPLITPIERTAGKTRVGTPARRRGGLRRWRLMLAALTLLGVGAAVAWLDTADWTGMGTGQLVSAPAPRGPAGLASKPSGARASRPKSASSPVELSSPSEFRSGNPGPSLETISGQPEPDGDAPPVASEAFAETFSLSGLSLDTFMPVDEAQRTRGDEQTPQSAPETVAGTDITQPDTAEEIVAGALPRPTSIATPVQSKVTAAEVPIPPDADSGELPPPVLLLSRPGPPAGLRLEFPAPVPLTLQADEQLEQTWTILSTSTGSPVARLRWKTEQMDREGSGAAELWFRWLADAASARDAALLAHGRLVSGSGDTVYLRAQLEADPITLDFVDRDERFQWKLGCPIESSATQVSIRVEVPDDVAIRWIEPTDEHSPRNTRGIATLALKDSPESSALVLRVDLRTKAALSMRIRCGARLDPELPWQWTDAPTIRRMLQAMTTQLQYADEQLLRLDAAISQARRQRARRQEAVLESQRDQIVEGVRNAATLAKRLAELDQLVALLEADACITATLSVPWPSGETQTLLDLHAVR